MIISTVFQGRKEDPNYRIKGKLLKICSQKKLFFMESEIAKDLEKKMSPYLYIQCH